MADEVYKILQSRLRRNAQQQQQQQQQQQHSQHADCEGCRKASCQKAAEDSTGQSHKRRRNATTGEDPMSHKIIEKRRRDRMNSCLADLSHLIPSNYLKKGRGRIEKTEIVEMAIKHIKYFGNGHQAHQILAFHCPNFRLFDRGRRRKRKRKRIS